MSTKMMPLISCFVYTRRTLYIEMACNGLFGEGKGDQISPPDTDKVFTVQSVELVVVDKDVRQLLYDLQVLHMIAEVSIY